MIVVDVKNENKNTYDLHLCFLFLCVFWDLRIQMYRVAKLLTEQMHCNACNCMLAVYCNVNISVSRIPTFWTGDISHKGTWNKHYAAGPHLWNSVPVQLRNPEITYELFQRQLKGHILESMNTALCEYAAT